jgi:hypothetical protein
MPTASPKRPPEVAEGVYRLGTRWINFSLVADGAEYTLVDSGYPGYWKYLSAANASPGFYRRCSVHLSGLRFIAHSAVAGGAKYRPVQTVESLTHEEATIDLPGRPRSFTPPGTRPGTTQSPSLIGVSCWPATRWRPSTT